MGDNEAARVKLALGLASGNPDLMRVAMRSALVLLGADPDAYVKAARASIVKARDIGADGRGGA